ncbi:MAG: serine/threonine-protein kinase [Myxococcota bacterium]
MEPTKLKQPAELPPTTKLGDYLGLPSVERGAVYRRVLARMAGEDADEPEATRIGRYEFIRRLGAGGMGVVYLVRDPDLDRKIALKMLHPRLRHADDADERRMRREARAMARLDHDNVVRVHELGTHEGRLYLAMEYVEGTTLSGWLTGPQRHWSEIVRVFCRAGAGLVAAHEAGLAHCDFKPDNVLLSDEGAVKVSDFGLVRVLGDTDEFQAARGMESTDALPSITQSTTQSTIAGTPAYMAPEQLAGSRGDTRSDQFGFCVALYTALLGQPPFEGSTVAELTRSMAAGLRAPQARRAEVPAEVLAALERGLEQRADDRWPSMSALIAQLEQELARPRRCRCPLRTMVTVLGLGVTARAA